MEGSFSRQMGPAVPGQDHFVRESSSSSLDLRDPKSRARYLDDEMQRVRARAIEQEATAQASREAFFTKYA